MKWRVLAGAVALAALAWSGWWFFSAGLRDEALAGWLEARRAEGWQAEAAEIRTGGFPNRIDTRIVEPALADPAAGWAWRAPFLDVLTLAYEPNAAIVAFPPEQSLAAPGARASLTSDRLRASIRFVPGPSLELTRVSMVGEGMSLSGDGWRAGAANAEAHVEAVRPAVENAYRLFFGAEAVTLPDGVRNRLDVAGALPAVAERLRVDAVATFDRALDRFALEDAPPGVRALSIRSLEARWGDLALTATGDLRADAEGYAEGSLDVRAENWRAMLRAAVAAGALDANAAGLIEGGLGLLARLSGDGDALSAPLSFSGGAARIGPVPIGEAPRLMPRG